MKDYELICGMLADWPQSATEPTVDTMNDFDVLKDLETNKHILGVETMLGFKSPDGAKKYVQECLDVFTKYMEENNLDTSKELDLYEVFTEGININTEFDDLETAYAAMKFFVRGFEGRGLEIYEKGDGINGD